MNDILAAVAIIAPLTVPLTEAVKRVAKLPDRFAPLVAIGCGLGAAFLFPPELAVQNELASGVIAGFSAAGLWSGTKALAGK